MADMANEIKLLSGNSHPSLAKAVADRYVSVPLPSLPPFPTSDVLHGVHCVSFAVRYNLLKTQFFLPVFHGSRARHHGWIYRNKTV